MRLGANQNEESVGRNIDGARLCTKCQLLKLTSPIRSHHLRSKRTSMSSFPLISVISLT